MRAVAGFAIIAAVLVGHPPPPETTTLPAPGGRLVVGAGNVPVRPPPRLAPRPDPGTRAHRIARERRQPVSSGAEQSVGGWPWIALAECESGGDWGENAGTIYEGGLQFHPQTWSAYRLPGFPPRAYMATPDQQIQVAELVLLEQGWGAWPACARKLGLR